MPGSKTDFLFIEETFQTLIRERAKYFTGRSWIFSAIHKWLADPNGKQIFLLVGEPGSGKSTIASRLVQLSQDPSLPTSELKTGFLSAYYFCQREENYLNTPRRLIEFLRGQLEQRYPGYFSSVEENKPSQIHSHQHVEINLGEANATRINNIEHVEKLIVGSSNADDFDPFHKIVEWLRQPLWALIKDHPDLQPVILIDALDEAFLDLGHSTIFSLLTTQLDKFHRNVRFILTTRPDDRILGKFRKKALFCEISNGDHQQQNVNDIRAFIDLRLEETRLHEWITHVQDGEKAIALITRKADGNFLYVHHLLDNLVSGSQSFIDLDKLPDTLDNFYQEFLSFMIKQKGATFNDYARLLKVLSITKESLTLSQLVAFTQQPVQAVSAHLEALQQIVKKEIFRETDQKKTIEVARYRIYHSSFSDFLHSPKAAKEYYLSEKDCHRLIAEVGLNGGWSGEVPRKPERFVEKISSQEIVASNSEVSPREIEQGKKAYALTHTITHLYHAEMWRELFDILDKGEYGKAKIRYYNDNRYTYIQDLDLGRQAAAERVMVDDSIDSYSLVKLWSYTLLRGSLASLDYPLETLRLLLLLKGKQQALGRARSIPNPVVKATALLLIVRELSAKDEDRIVLLQETLELSSTLENSQEQDQILYNHAMTCVGSQTYELAETALSSMKLLDRRIEAWRLVGREVAKQACLEWAEKLWRHAIEDLASLPGTTAKLQKYSDLSKLLAEYQLSDLLGCVLAQAIQLIFSSKKAHKYLEDFVKLIDDFGKYQQIFHDSTLLKNITQAVIIWPKEKSKDRILLALSNATLQSHQFTQTLSLIEQVSCYEQQEPVLLKLISAAIAEQHLHIASAALAIIKPSEEKVRLLYELGNAQEHTQCNIQEAISSWKQAERILTRSQDHQPYIRARFALGRALLRSGQAEQARSLWLQTEDMFSYVSDPRQQDQVRWHLVESWVSLPDLEYALAATAAISDKNLQKQAFLYVLENMPELPIPQLVQLLGKVSIPVKLKVQILFRRSSEYIQAGKDAQAHECWTAAKTLIKKIPESTQRNQLWSDGLRVYMQAQQWKWVASTLSFISDRNLRAQLQQELFVQYLHAGEWSFCRQTIKSFRGASTQKRARLQFIQALIEHQQWERASQILIAMKNQVPGLQMGQTLLTALLQAAEWKLARRLFSEIQDPGERSQVGVQLVQTFIQHSMWEQAFQIICDIEKSQITKADTYNSFQVAFLQTQLLMQLWQALQETQLTELIQAIALKFKNLLQQMCENARNPRDLQKLSGMLVEYRLWSQALAVIQLIQPEEQQIQTRFHLGTALIQASDWQKAEALVSTFPAAHPLQQTFQTLLRCVSGQRGDETDAEANWLRLQQLVKKQKSQNTRDELWYDISQAFASQLLWGRATSANQFIKNPPIREKALCQLIAAMLSAEKYSAASQVIDGTPDNQLHARLSALLGCAYLKARQWRSAKRALLAIRDPHQREQALSDYYIAELKRDHQWDRAMRNILYLIHEKLQRQNIECWLEEVGAAHHWGSIENVLQLLENKNTRKPIQAIEEVRQFLTEKLVTVLIQWGEYARALSLITALQDKVVQEQAYYELILAHILSGNYEPVLSLIAMLQQRRLKAYAYLKLVLAHMKQESWEEAGKIIGIIPYDELSQGDVTELQKFLTAAPGLSEKVWQTAEQVVFATQDSQQRANMLYNLSIVASELGAIEVASRYIDEMEKKGSSVQLLCDLGSAFARANQISEAQSIWQRVQHSISPYIDQEIQLAALCSLGRTFAGVEQTVALSTEVWAKARALVEAIPTALTRVQALCYLANEAEQSGCDTLTHTLWEQAKTFPNHCETRDERLQVLYHLSEALQKAGQQEHAQRTTTLLLQDLTNEQTLSESMLSTLYEFGRRFARKPEHGPNAETPWKKACKIIEKRKNTSERDELLYQMATTLLTCEQFGCDFIRETIIPALNEEQLRTKLLLDLHRIYMSFKKWHQAYEILEQIRAKDEEKYKNLAREFVDIVVQNKLWDDLPKVINFIDIDDLSVRNVQKVAAALALSARNLHEIKSRHHFIINNIADEKRRLVALCEYGIVLAQSEHRDYAREKVWEQIERLAVPNRNQARALRELASVLAQIHPEPVALGEVERIITDIDDAWQRFQGFMGLSRRYAESNNMDLAQRAWAQAESILNVHLTSPSLTQTQGLIALGLFHFSQGNIPYGKACWKQAEESLKFITGDNRAAALLYWVDAYIALGDVDGARVKALSIANSSISKRAEAFTKLMKALLQDNRLAEALQAFKEISDKNQRVIALSILYQFYEMADPEEIKDAQEKAAHTRNQLEEILTRTTDLRKRVEGLSAFAQVLDAIYSGDQADEKLQRAKHDAQLIKEREDRYWASHALFNALAHMRTSNDRFKLMIEILRDHWLSVQRRAEAVRFFPLVTFLLPLLAETGYEMGLELYNAFLWENEILKQYFG